MEVDSPKKYASLLARSRMHVPRAGLEVKRDYIMNTTCDNELHLLLIKSSAEVLRDQLILVIIKTDNRYYDPVSF